MYRYGAISVEDYFEDIAGNQLGAFFRRTLTFTAPESQPPFFFRLASGKQVIATDAGQWQIDRLKLNIQQHSRVRVREGYIKDLLLELTLPKGKTVLKLEYRW